MQILLIFALIIAVLAGLFAAQNNQLVTVRFLVWSIQSPSALVILISILAGVLISLFASTPSMIRNKNAQRAQRKRIGELETKVSDSDLKLAAQQQKISDLETAGAQKPSVPPTQP
jgi:lipopolysaccharide assembly protein A